MDVKAGVTEAALFPVSFKLISERFVELSSICSLGCMVSAKSRGLLTSVHVFRLVGLH